jgi:hypothetical protein
MHDHIQQRTFITTPSSSPLRPTVKAAATSTSTSTSTSATQSSLFNTSRALKAVLDNSTIDFAFLPSIPPPPPSHEWIAVPFAPDNFAPMRTAVEEEAPVMRPEISVISHGGTEAVAPSAMTEVVDNAAMDIDPFSLVEKVRDAAAGAGRVEEKGLVREVIDEIWDDLIGRKGGTNPA